MKLYIIGNGFDLYHNIKSSYYNFKEYLQKHDSQLLKIIEEYLFYFESENPNENDLWCRFEENLAHLEEEKLRKMASNFLIDYGSEEWDDSANHNYSNEIGKVVEALTKRLRKRLTEWALTLKEPATNQKSLPIDKDAKFLSFNYTSTLEDKYKPLTKVLHIHGKADISNSELVLGHATPPNTPPQHKEIKKNMSAEDYQIYCEEHSSDDPRIGEGENELQNYWEKSFKDTSKIISDNQSFFDNLDNVDEVHVIGSSLSPIDLEYFKKISNKIPNARWIVSYHRQKDLEEYRNKLINDLEISENNIDLFYI
jgi:hypothetical protein